MSNKTPTAKTSSRKGRKKAYLIPHPCGETSMSSLSPVQLTSTKELRMWLLEAGPVSHFRWQEGAEERMIPGTAGPSASKLFAELSQDSFLEKTCQDSLIPGTSQKFSGRWPKQGMIQDGLCWELTMWEATTGEKGSGYWLTPQASDWKNMDTAKQKMLSKQAKMWPTPRAQDSKHGAATEWELNTDHMGTKGSLRVQVVKRGLWPTPTASTNGPGKNLDNPRGIHQGNALATAARMWPTPSATPRGAHTGAKSGEVSSDGKTRTSKNGTRWGATLQTSVGSGQLNPLWVEYLMGWPLGWTDLKPLAMDKFHLWLTLHGEC